MELSTLELKARITKINDELGRLIDEGADIRIAEIELMQRKANWQQRYSDYLENCYQHEETNEKRTRKSTK